MNIKTVNNTNLELSISNQPRYTSPPPPPQFIIFLQKYNTLYCKSFQYDLFLDIIFCFHFQILFLAIKFYIYSSGTRWHTRAISMHQYYWVGDFPTKNYILTLTIIISPHPSPLNQTTIMPLQHSLTGNGREKMNMIIQRC